LENLALIRTSTLASQEQNERKETVAINPGQPGTKRTQRNCSEDPCRNFEETHPDSFFAIVVIM
jgi:hypothetical protein